MISIPKKFQTPAAVLGYSLCSGTMLLFNKLAIFYIPSPSFVTFVQLIFATIVIILLQFAKVIEYEPLVWWKVRSYMLYVASFVFGVYCNMQALSYSNIETVIVFRSCTPLAVSVCDYVFLNRELPSGRSLLALLLISVGALGYANSDDQFKLEGISAYSWAIMYFFMIVFEMTYGKKMTSSIDFNSTWGPVYFTNLLSTLPMLLLGIFMGDYDHFDPRFFDWSVPAVAMLFLSSIVGLLIGWTGWTCRAMVTATSFTLVGVINKFLTILLNVFIWDKHASGTGIMALLLCLIGGSFYRQAPQRKTRTQSPSSPMRPPKSSFSRDAHKGSQNTLSEEDVANQFEMTGLLEDKEEV